MRNPTPEEDAAWNATTGGPAVEEWEKNGRRADTFPKNPPLHANVSASALERVEFPTDTFPGAVGEYIEAATTAIGCPVEFVALPLLACLGQAIGNRRRIRLKHGWEEPAIFWTVNVGASGSSKTPALQAATRPLALRQSAAIKRYEQDRGQWEQEILVFERDHAAWRRAKGSTPPPVRPQEPVCQRYLTSDCTIEALADRLSCQFDGLTVCRDELSGWLDGQGEYKAKRGSDTSHWLALWCGNVLTVDRKSTAKKLVHIERASVNVTGGIQPAELRRVVGREHMTDGLAARLLLAMPPAKEIRWTEAVVPRENVNALGDVFDCLLSLEPGENDEGEPVPIAIGLTAEAKDIWVDYYNAHRREMVDLDDDLRAAAAKCEAYSARLSLALQLCSWACGDGDCEAVDQSSMEAGITLSRWFEGEARRVYAMLARSDVDDAVDELITLIRRRGGRITPRELSRSSRKYAASALAEAALEGLVRAGLGRWEVVGTATNQRRDFVLNPRGPEMDPERANASHRY